MAEAQSTATNQTRAGNIPAIERATGRTWQEWVDLFDAHGCREAPRLKIVALARESVPTDLNSPDWWAQSAVIAYEQHIGRRVPGQSATGLFRVGTSRSLPLDRDEAIEAWAAAGGARTEHLGHEVLKARTARTDQRSFWRANLDGAGKLDVSATPKASGGVSLAIRHDGLPSPDRIEEWRAYWKVLLGEL